MSKINTDFMKKSINEMINERKQRKFVETVELQIGLRDYDPEKRFNGSVRLPNRAFNKVRVPIILPRFVSSPMLSISKKLPPTKSLILMSMDLRLSIRIKPKLKNGLRNMMSSSLLTPSLSKSLNFWATFWSSSESSPSPWLKEKSCSIKLLKSSTLLSSNQRKPHALEPPLETLSKQKNNLDKTSQWESTSWFR